MKDIKEMFHLMYTLDRVTDIKVKLLEGSRILGQLIFLFVIVYVFFIGIE